MTDCSLRRLSVEPHEDGWATVAGGEVVAITADRAVAEAVATLTEARVCRSGDQLRAD